MDKGQIIQYFWSQFGLTAYDENSVPDDAVMPYITYNNVTGDIEDVITLNASLWYRSTSWRGITEKSEEIAKYIGEYGHKVFKINNGYMWVTKGYPYSQRMSDPSDTLVKRMYLTVTAEFLTGY